ncbi:MAG: rRNA small subunit 7-methylguanosine (m7G) methyltransferase GidB [Candidatus Ozemobacter sibiricus]|uniref:Ribosomal RNA small subunit methyltransferase G n=1 Tax=Candidatus Ozemobacter sibiricus TaxID=2268124 RepID=A0A367ZTE7_9BACT|nr:MAG: rRNA small subunit 7-methylguanosine (m7G) methyltransferase GidB [Candidatus Ozemobacter sibiricus]
MAFLDHLPDWLDRLGLRLPPGVQERLEALCVAMTADPLYPSVSKISAPEEIATKHILDSLAPLALDLPCWDGLREGGSPAAASGPVSKERRPDRRRRRLVDLGTGGGFPALPLAIALPTVEVWAVDAKGKAIDFVTRLQAALGIDNLRPRLARAEELGREPGAREGFDLVVCRALASVRVLLEYCLPLTRVGGHVLMYKGPSLEAELAEAGKACQVLGVRQADLAVHVLRPPALPFERGYLLVAKQQPTPAAYPRRNGVPAARPL